MPATTKKNKARIIPCVAGFVSPVFGKEVGAGIFCPGVGDGTEDEPGVGVEVAGLNRVQSWVEPGLVAMIL